MSTTAVPDNNPKYGFMMTQVVPPAAAGQNVVVPGPGVATGSILNVGAYNIGGPTAGFPNVGVPFVTPVSNIQTGPIPNNLQKFLKSKPMALGTVQIMIGFTIIALGILITISMRPFSVLSGITYWGSVVYIITGSLTVAAESKLNSCLVKGSLGMNVFSAIVAGTAVILLSSDIIQYVHNNICYLFLSEDYKCMLLTYGVSGMLLILTVLQLIISICISAFGCNATCDNKPKDVHCIANRAVNVNDTPTDNPPAHTSSARPEDSVMVNGF